MSSTPNASTEISPVVTAIQAQVLINTGESDGVEAQHRLANSLTVPELQAVQELLQK